MAQKDFPFSEMLFRTSMGIVDPLLSLAQRRVSNVFFFFCKGPPNEESFSPEFWPLGWTTSLDSESEQKHPFTNHRSPDNMS